MTIANFTEPALVQKSLFEKWFPFFYSKVDKTVEDVVNQMTEIQKLVVLSTEAEYQAFLTYLDDRVTAIMHPELFSFDLERIYKNAGLKKKMQAAITMLRSFDRFPENDNDLLIENDAIIIGSLEEITNLLDVLSSLEKNTLKEYESVDLRNRITNVYNNVSSRMQSPGTVKKKSLAGWKQEAYKANELHSIKNQTYDFSMLSKLTSISERFQKALQNIEKAESGFLNIEDTYVIKEIKEAYLPNLYRAVASLKDLDASTLTSLEEDFAIQMDFIEVEINRIRHMLRDRAVDSIKSQTAFAKTKLKVENINDDLFLHK
jgi:hypothetical protein